MNKKNYLPKLLYLITKKICWNKYFIIFFCFSIWMIFFDKHSILSHYELYQNIKKIENKKIKLQKNIKHSIYLYKILQKNKSKKTHYEKEEFFYKKNIIQNIIP